MGSKKRGPGQQVGAGGATEGDRLTYMHGVCCGGTGHCCWRASPAAPRPAYDSPRPRFHKRSQSGGASRVRQRLGSVAQEALRVRVPPPPRARPGVALSRPAACLRRSALLRPLLAPGRTLTPPPPAWRGLPVSPAPSRFLPRWVGAGQGAGGVDVRWSVAAEAAPPGGPALTAARLPSCQLWGESRECAPLPFTRGFLEGRGT